MKRKIILQFEVLFAAGFLSCAGVFILCDSVRAEQNTETPTNAVTNAVAAPAAPASAALEVIETDLDPEAMPASPGGLKPNATFVPISANAENGPTYVKPVTLNELREQQVIQINDSLRRLIEENEKIKFENELLDKQVQQLRGMVTFETKRNQTLSTDQERYKKENERIIELSKKSQADLEQMKNALLAREQAITAKMNEVTEKEKLLNAGIADAAELAAITPEAREAVAGKEKNISATATMKNKSDAQIAKEKENVLRVLDEIGRETVKMKLEQGKVHYNMGNMYFGRGEYDHAFKEFKRAVELMPQDCNAHFNLAFVSSEHIRDYKTALDNYQEYLFLNPAAEDVMLVQEKIIESKLKLQGKIASSLDDEYIEKNKYNRR